MSERSESRTMKIGRWRGSPRFPGRHRTRLVQAPTGEIGDIITSDSFTGGDDADIAGRTSDAALGGVGATWASSTTTIGIIGGQLYRNGGTGVRSARLGTAIADVDITATIGALGTATNYLVARWTDDSNYYRLGFTNVGVLFVAKVVAGVATTIILPGTTVLPGDRVGLRCVGTLIQLVKNGVLQGEVTDTDFATGTAGAGYATTETTTRLDDLIIREGVVLPFP